MPDDHPRLLTKQQFSDGTTIDGSRIDDALEDVIERVNKIPEGYLAKRWTQSQFVMGWNPQDRLVGNTHHWPWMSAINNDSQSVLPRPDSYENELRAKGTRVPGIDILTNAADSQYVWETSWYFDKPVILSSVCVMLTTDHNSAPAPNTPYVNPFTYGATPPAGFVLSDPTEDVSLLITSDSEFDRENRTAADVEFARHRFKVNASAIMPVPVAIAAPVNDMTPTPYAGGVIDGAYLHFRGNDPGSAAGLNIPIRQRSRVRFQMVIPGYSAATESTWLLTPWYMQCVTATVTILEPLP